MGNSEWEIQSGSVGIRRTYGAIADPARAAGPRRPDLRPPPRRRATPCAAVGCGGRPRAAVRKDLVDHQRWRDAGDEAHHAVARRTRERVDFEDLLEQRRPPAGALCRRQCSATIGSESMISSAFKGSDPLLRVPCGVCWWGYGDRATLQTPVQRLRANAHLACSGTSGSSSCCARVRTSTSSVVPTLPRTTAAFRCSPANLARFIGDFRNAALNAS